MEFSSLVILITRVHEPYGNAAGSMIGCIHVLFQSILVAIFKFNYHGTIRVDPDIHIQNVSEGLFTHLYYSNIHLNIH